MPVIGTPVLLPPPSPGTCDAQAIHSPVITQLYGIDLPTKRRAIAVSSGSKATLQLQLLDAKGNVIDISDCGGNTGSVIAKMREVIKTKLTDISTVNGTVSDSVNGIIQFLVPAIITDNPGVYNCELGLYDSDANLIFTNQFYLWINRGLFGNPKYPNAGPPSIDEVRMYLRDNAPEENRLLDDFEFDLTEICYATELAVRYWNESQPPINIYFHTTNYVVRDKWLMYISGHLLLTAAHRFRRNHLPYSAGGISVDDQNKFQQYEQTGMRMQQEYKEWVKQKKVQINSIMAMTSSGSSYGSFAYQLLNTGV